MWEYGKQGGAPGSHDWRLTNGSALSTNDPSQEPQQTIKDNTLECSGLSTHTECTNMPASENEGIMFREIIPGLSEEENNRQNIQQQQNMAEPDLAVHGNNYSHNGINGTREETHYLLSGSYHADANPHTVENISIDVLCRT
mgnify:CR=1 FL=1